ncbi:MAG: hypothetical protein COT24_04805 [Candidatus Kerfeldbacteria bacterium CG08_land_8_20_14_0_20_40_16]|uniref:Uncharacterized protein n=1 Tax=Candidatus Kerfeldbacteria bacterium CG08_land_8_20_14_0_20_40_16 TaxID=2014244 RepID=A0A2H0YWU1_9BACT|nr:MAG: hypothetical protein COT24_04805 [Candidatus Kerfeldbacteria bacterium CG08_land_8_20_14_0_20_40_16]
MPCQGMANPPPSNRSKKPSQQVRAIRTISPTKKKIIFLALVRSKIFCPKDLLTWGYPTF